MNVPNCQGRRVGCRPWWSTLEQPGPNASRRDKPEPSPAAPPSCRIAGRRRRTRRCYAAERPPRCRSQARPVQEEWLDAGAGGVRPLALDDVPADGLRLPCADVTDLTDGVVVPPGPGHRIGDRLAQLVRR